MILLKVITAKNGFLIMGLNFKILFVMIVMISLYCLNISDIAIITVKELIIIALFRIIVVLLCVSKSEAIRLLENSVLDYGGYIKSMP